MATIVIEGDLIDGAVEIPTSVCVWYPRPIARITGPGSNCSGLSASCEHPNLMLPLHLGEAPPLVTNNTVHRCQHSATSKYLEVSLSLLYPEPMVERRGETDIN